MTQAQTDIVVPEPQGTSQVSFHAVGSFERWTLTALSAWDEGDIEVDPNGEAMTMAEPLLPEEQ